MANTAVRQIGYTGTVEEIVWNAGQGNGVQVSAYLWGGGGGGGGNDSPGVGGAGSGGGYSQVNFTINEGDSIRIAVGGNGTAGVGYRGGAPGGNGGGSYLTQPVFNTRSASTISYTYDGVFYPAISTYAVSDRAWSTLLNTQGIWTSASTSAIFNGWYQINFPTTGYYTFSLSTDNYGSITIPSVFNFSWSDYRTTGQKTQLITAGTKYMWISGVNTGGPGGIAVTISGGFNYSGGRGGSAGGGGSSGGGGGGGGATVLLKNGVVIGVAGGGAGGGGGGHVGAVNGQAAPGTSGRQSPGTDNGQDGEDKYGDGGGGGGGGGGNGGGNGGAAPYEIGDQGGYAGTGGGSFSASGATGIAFNQTPAGANTPYYSASRGRGGASSEAGTSGWAALEFGIGGVYVRDGGSWWLANPYIRNNGSWRNVLGTYVKQNGVWQPVNGTFAPTFNYYSNLFGVQSRIYPPYVPPPDPGY